MSLAANLAIVEARVRAACERAGRERSAVRLLAVSKTHPIDVLREAHAAGVREFAENRVQEALAKSHDLADLADVRWVMIGHLQSNKARDVARFAHEFQGLDSVPLAVELDRRLQAVGRPLDVFIEVNTSGEASKFGVAPDGVLTLVAALGDCSALRLRGLMTIAANTSDQTVVGACFDTLARLAQQVEDVTGTPQELSMGMSGDLELAIAHGSTCVRVGTAIFGHREV